MKEVKITKSINLELKEYKQTVELSERTGIPINRLLETLLKKGYEEMIKSEIQ